MATASWYRTGIVTEEEIKQTSPQRSGPRDWRFWLKEGDKRNLAFLDGTDDGFRIKEHDFEINGKWGNTFTCRDGLDFDEKGVRLPCPLCSLADARGRKGAAYIISFFTIVDLTPWKDKNGQEHPYFVKMLGVKKETLAKIKMIREANGGSLVGHKFLVMRSKPVVAEGDKRSKTPRVGDIWQPLGLTDVTQFKMGKENKPAAPFDYTKLLEPKTLDELKKFASDLGAGVATTSEAEEVPY